MLPGKKYTPEDILHILKRRVWLLVVPFALVSAAVAVYVRRLPDLYRSETLILVVPPRVPEGFVGTQVSTKLEDRLPAIQQQIFSRTRLERIIQDLNLYQEERRTGIMEDIVDRMRNSIKVETVRGDAFRVGFVGNDPRTVMKVAERLSTLFIEESSRDREVLIEGTDSFLESQLDQARSRLIDHEKKLEEYRRKYAGELPSQTESNIQAVQNMQLQVRALVDQIDRDQERRLNLERQLADLQQQQANAGPSAAAAAAAPDSTQAKLDAARAQLAAMRLTMTEEHPDVQRLEHVVRDLGQKAETEALAAPVSGAARAASPVQLAAQRRTSDLQNQIEQLTQQIARNQGEAERLRTTAGEYQRRAEAAPTRETELISLNRDYNTLQGVYTSLLGKKEAANIAANLERRQIGEQFNLLDPARIPERPFSPNRQRLNLIGIAAGLAMGAVLIALLEYRDVTLKTDAEVTAVLSLPVLAVVPLMRSEVERRRHLRYQLLLGTGLGGTVLVCIAVLVYTFLR